MQWQNNRLSITSSSSNNSNSLDDDDIHSMPIFQDNLGKLLPECLHSGFYWSKGRWRWWGQQELQDGSSSQFKLQFKPCLAETCQPWADCLSAPSGDNYVIFIGWHRVDCKWSLCHFGRLADNGYTHLICLPCRFFQLRQLRSPISDDRGDMHLSPGLY